LVHSFDPAGSFSRAAGNIRVGGQHSSRSDRANRGNKRTAFQETPTSNLFMFLFHVGIPFDKQYIMSGENCPQ
jgi:hypothetical protein